jgi:hypothetical protein
MTGDLRRAMRGFLPSHRHGPHTEITTDPVRPPDRARAMLQAVLVPQARSCSRSAARERPGDPWRRQSRQRRALGEGVFHRDPSFHTGSWPWRLCGLEDVGRMWHQAAPRGHGPRGETGSHPPSASPLGERQPRDTREGAPPNLVYRSSTRSPGSTRTHVKRRHRHQYRPPSMGDRTRPSAELAGEPPVRRRANQRLVARPDRGLPGQRP